ncbi:MAG: RtcB family protein [Actinobacteria bacterium]|nr:RtcB family protein [Actinomycetota bacterium]
MPRDQPRLIPDGPDRWRVEPVGGMRVPGVVFASAALLPDIAGDEALQQLVNVASLPGIVAASFAMPDVHWGYGFPIGGVAATDVDHGGVISPGGVGFDISCGVRLLASAVPAADVDARMDLLMDALARAAPHGLGPGGVWSQVDDATLDAVLTEGSRVAVDRGFGEARDLDRCEDHGALAGAAPGEVGERARDRGRVQLGSLGAGNHFLEVQAVDRVDEPEVAEAFGLVEGQVCVMIHCGSRGLGHQVCTDQVKVMERSMGRFGITVPDRQLACVPVRSPEGESYLGAMAASANYGRANRQLLAHVTRQAFAEVFGDADLPLVYDVSHNLAKLERHQLDDGAERLLCVHRKGATRAFPAGHAELSGALSAVGQPVIVPGSMGTASWVLVGTGEGAAFHSTCHGAGRTMSRAAARKRVHGRDLARELEAQHIAVRAGSWKGLAEEAPFSYKDVDEVVATCARAGLARPVARLRPLGVLKG